VIHGIDVSEWQGEIDWKLVPTDLFVIVRLTHGATIDPRALANLKGCAGRRVGAYHYLEARVDVYAQARAFLEVLPESVDLLALDIEEGAANVAEHALEWLAAVEDVSGATPLVYTNTGFGAAHGFARHPELARYPLWVAHWPRAGRTLALPSIPEPWTSWSIWQHSNVGHVPGIRGPVDLNCMQESST